MAKALTNWAAEEMLSDVAIMGHSRWSFDGVDYHIADGTRSFDDIRFQFILFIAIGVLIAVAAGYLLEQTIAPDAEIDTAEMQSKAETVLVPAYVKVAPVCKAGGEYSVSTRIPDEVNTLDVECSTHGTPSAPKIS